MRLAGQAADTRLRQLARQPPAHTSPARPAPPARSGGSWQDFLARYDSVLHLYNKPDWLGQISIEPKPSTSGRSPRSGSKAPVVVAPKAAKLQAALQAAGHAGQQPAAAAAAAAAAATQEDALGTVGLEAGGEEGSGSEEGEDAMAGYRYEDEDSALPRLDPLLRLEAPAAVAAEEAEGGGAARPELLPPPPPPSPPT